MVKWLWLCLILCCVKGFSVQGPVNQVSAEKKEKAPPMRATRLLSVDLGAGLPHLLGAQVGFRAFRKWHFGAGYGIFGSQMGFNPTYNIGSKRATLKDGTPVLFPNPTAQTSLTAVNPFIRFFPKEDNFYFQITCGVMFIYNEFTSPMNDSFGNTIDGGQLRVRVQVTQLLPTLSIGNFFGGRVMFFNPSIGVSFIANTFTKYSVVGSIPDRFGGTAQNSEALDELGLKTRDAVNAAMTELRSNVLVIPSFSLMVGFWL